MEKQKRFSISEAALLLLMEQVQLQPKVTASAITSLIQNDIIEIKEDKVDEKESE